MRTIFLDFETYYDKEYSLRKMTPVEYILDPRFETILCAVRESYPSNKPPYFVDGADFGKWVKDAKLEDASVVTFNALFDMCIMAWRYDCVPRLMVDMLGVSRALLGHRLRSLSLKNVARHLNLGAKGDTVHNVIGMNRATIKANGLWNDYAAYSMLDNELCEGIYEQLVRSGRFPVGEIAIMDTVLRCAIKPKFRLDQMVLAEHLHAVKQKKEQLLAQALSYTNDGKKDLMSNDKFAELLRGVGVEPPTKVSPRTGKLAYAFAKTDEDFLELEEHPDARVQALVAARLGLKTTLEESRTERMIAISNLTWPGNEQGRMPIPLRYGGAHTHRLSGDWKLNLQNLPRGGKLRDAIVAPPGHTVLTIDASQIEARITAWLCGQEDLVQQFANGEDVYSTFASEIFGYSVHKSTHPKERFLGKTSVLGLGFQVGGAKFQNTIEVQSQLQLGEKIEMSLEEAFRIVDLYRRKYHKISAMWRTLHNVAIPVLSGGGTFTLGPCTFGRGAVLLPSGLHLHYHDLHQVEGERGPQWEFTYATKPKKLYGGKLLENVVQALARITTMDASTRIRRRMLELALQVHDELVYVVPDAHADQAKAIMLDEMRRRPSWAPDLPIEAELGVGASYGAAK
jgi:hypothetical protein